MATVLIIDDHEDVRDALSNLLQDAGYATLTAEDGLTGLEAVAASRPDVILLDIAMPGIDGLETLRRLKASANTSAIPVVMVTANGNREFMVTAVQCGTRDYICKPWEDGEVEMVIRWALNSSKGIRAAAA